jgi:excisionase family DNA binding protein
MERSTGTHERIEETRDAFRPGEVAARLGVSRDWIDDRIACGELRAVKIGRAVLVPRSEIDRLLAPAATSSAG